MAPASNMRKSSTTTMAHSTEMQPSLATIASHTQPRRSTTGRAIRVNTTRPTNYYARPFRQLDAANEDGLADLHGGQGHGFYPGLQYFADAITALPKEVMKQFTLMKEVEAKIHGPSERLNVLIDALMTRPVPRRKQMHAGAGAGLGLLSFTAHNSTSGSTNASVVNGMAGPQDAQASHAGSVDGEELVDSQEELARRMQYVELCKDLKSLIPNLDEKHGVLEEANRVLALQEMRLDSVMPHVENEISEEARLGSMTHWAYADNRQRKQAGGGANRRDVAAANSLAAAASLIHEHEISTARRDAGKEAAREKTKGKRVEHPVDSDFDEKPKKQKLGKIRAAQAETAAVATGLGISAAEPATKRKKAVERVPGAVGMERTVSASGRGSKAAREAQRTPASADSAAPKKVSKAKQAPPVTKRKVPNSAQASPMMAGSPLVVSQTQSTPEVSALSKQPGARSRAANAATTNLRHEKLQVEESNSRPPSSSGKVAIATSAPVYSPAAEVVHKSNGAAELGSSINERSIDAGTSAVTAGPATNHPGSATAASDKPNGRRKPGESVKDLEPKAGAETTAHQLTEVAEKLKREDVVMTDNNDERRPSASQSVANSNIKSGRGSAISTPKAESFPLADNSMTRTRSVRGKPNGRSEGRDSTSSEPVQSQPSKHKRVASNSHLVKQLAPFNRSPDLDRHRSRDDMDDDLDSNEEKTAEPDQLDDPINDSSKDAEASIERSTRRASTRRPISRRNTGPLRSSSPAAAPRDATTPDNPLPTVASPVPVPPPSTRQQRSSQFTSRTPQQAPPPVADAEEDEEDSEHDPDDPNEPKYCYCNRGSYGEMVACDNDDCTREWFHLGCTELREAPGEEEVWYCRECRPKFGRKVKGRNGRAG
jgi:hypothetical protein